MSWVGLQCVIVVFPDHTHLLFDKITTLDSGKTLFEMSINTGQIYMGFKTDTQEK